MIKSSRIKMRWLEISNGVAQKLGSLIKNRSYHNQLLKNKVFGKWQLDQIACKLGENKEILLLYRLFLKFRNCEFSKLLKLIKILLYFFLERSEISRMANERLVLHAVRNVHPAEFVTHLKMTVIRKINKTTIRFSKTSGQFSLKFISFFLVYFRWFF